MLGVLKDSQIEHLLYSQVIGRIGCHADNMTYIVPITYAYDGTYIYGHTKEGLKINMMRKNPNVCLEVDVIDDISNWRSVIALGKFEELKTSEEREMGMQKLMDRVLPIMTSETTVHHAMTDSHGKYTEAMQGVVYRIKLTEKTGRYEKR